MKLVTLLQIVLLVAIAAILYPVFVAAKPTSHRSSCLSKVKGLALGAIIYSEDSDDRFPGRDSWSDATFPYVKNWGQFHCPYLVGSAWGYAFNAALDHAKLKGDAAQIPLVYDSVNLIKNASDLVTSLPAVPRHTLNCMAYADGHAKSVGTEGVR